MRRTLITAFMALTMLVAMFAPALAQEPYPPAPPTGGEFNAVVECHMEGREIVCTGLGFAPGSTVTLEVRQWILTTSAASARTAAAIPADVPAGSVGPLIGTTTATVAADGSFRVDLPLPCDFTDDYVYVRISGTDADGDAGSLETVLEVGDIPACAVSGGDVSGGVGGTGTGGLSDTGRNIGILLALAIALMAAGAVILRRRQDDGPAHG